jgi:predicted nucleotidyltransferase
MSQPESEIAARLASVEADFNVRVLYACESGSRAWGFASPDSDWDVRFLYVHPLDWYLSVSEHRDVIELPIVDDLDINGWELRKALRLMRKGNPVLLEWLNSPIRYRVDADFLATIRALAEAHYSPIVCFHHYLHTAHNNWRGYPHEPTVKLKKYLYVLRPVLACRWIEAGRGMAPMEFIHLVEATVTDADLRAAIDQLLVLKRASGEIGLGPSIPEIDAFLMSEIARLANVARTLPSKGKSDNTGMDVLLRKTILGE